MKLHILVNSQPIKVMKILLTGHGEGDHLAEDAAHAVLGDALVAARVRPLHALDFVKMLRGKLGDEVAIPQPAVLGLGEA